MMVTRRFTFFLDTFVLVALTLIRCPRLTGLSLHEWLGIAFAAPELVHLLFSWCWIRRASCCVLMFRNRRLLLNDLLKAVLFVLIGSEVISGIVISQVVLPFIASEPSTTARGAHFIALCGTGLCSLRV